MNAEVFKERTQAFALRIIRLVEALPENKTSGVLGKQLLRSGTSVGANYRAACRGRSTPDFIAKMGIVVEEADECLYWLDLLVQSEQITAPRIQDLRQEAEEILAMSIASIKTARSRK